MYENRNLKQEMTDLGIVSMEDGGFGSRESAFAALDAVRQHNKDYPQESLVEMMENARRDAAKSMSGREGDC
jgi:hypothetical protein